MRQRVAVSLKKTLYAIFHLGTKLSTRSVVVAQPDERHANRTASVLEWYDRHRAYNSWLKVRRRTQKTFTVVKILDSL